jgi:hypothetical protein
MGGQLREITGPFVAAGPAGATARTRLHATSADADVLAAVGAHLGSLASADLAARCAEGRLDNAGRAASRAIRKQRLTSQSTSRWAGAITRVSEDSWQLADRNLRAERTMLRSKTRTIESRLAIPVGTRCGRQRGYADQAERWQKQQKLQRLKARLADVDTRITEGR